jgi:hypothetical protein
LTLTVNSFGNLIRKSSCFPCRRIFLTGISCDWKFCLSRFVGRPGAEEARREIASAKLAAWNKPGEFSSE